MTRIPFAMIRRPFLISARLGLAIFVLLSSAQVATPSAVSAQPSSTPFSSSSSSLGPLAAFQDATALRLSWKEYGPPIGLRILDTWRAVVLPWKNCSDWQRINRQQLGTADLKLLPGPDRELKESARRHYFEVEEGGVAYHLLLAPLPTGFCYRFELTVLDARDVEAYQQRTWLPSPSWRPRLASSSSEMLHPGRLFSAGNLIPIFTGLQDVWQPRMFVADTTNYSCMAAAAQMIINLVTGQASDPSAQLFLLRYAQAHDTWLTAPPHTGTDLQGIATTLSRFAGVGYEVAQEPSLQAALHLAAVRMRQTGLPSQIIVMRGLLKGNIAHAWLMVGFEAKTDPLLDPDSKIEAVYIAGGWWPALFGHHLDPAPNTRISAERMLHYYNDNYTPGWWPILVPEPVFPVGWQALPHSLAEIAD